MKVIERPGELRGLLERARAEGRRVGLVPTMGALHGGHRSMIRRAAAECDFVTVTVFVNPLQFAPSEDFDSYPRDLPGDCAQAEEAGAHLVFAPRSEVVFPQAPLTVVSVDALSRVMEGRHRPGHFDGVATIMTKLFALAGLCTAYFGEKDYQQLIVIRQLVHDLSLPVEVVACSTVREPDGLALSSRNSYMGVAERAAAPALYWSLLAGKRVIEERGVNEADVVRAAMTETAAREKLLQLDYAEVADPETLAFPKVITGETRLLIAGRLGRTRLIDNIAVGPPGGGS